VLQVQVLLAVRFTLGLLLAASSIGKLIHIARFANTLRGLGVRRRFTLPLALIFTITEGCLSVLLLGGAWTVPIALAAVSLFALFGAVSLWAARYRPGVPCSCFGVTQEVLGLRTASRAAALLALSLLYLALIVVAGQDRASVETVFSAGLMALGVILLSRWIMFLPTLVSLIEHRRQGAAVLDLLEFERHPATQVVQ